MRLDDVLSSTVKARLWNTGVDRAGSLDGLAFKVYENINDVGHA